MPRGVGIIGAVPPPIYALAARDVGQPPEEWILLLPAGNEVRLRDGRVFGSAGAEAVVAEWRRQNVKLPVDLNHAEMWRAPIGGEAPAYGWVTAMEARGAEVWGRVEWTDEGRELLSSRKYRYYSPTYSLTGGGEIYAITSVALVNRPALPEAGALARDNGGNQEGSMKEIAKALGLSESATEAEIVARIGAGGAGTAAATASRQVNMVPKADYDAVLARAEAAEGQVKQTAADELRREAETVVTAAITKGVAAPASKEFWLGLCATRDGLTSVKAHLESAPPVVNTATAGAATAGAAPPAKETRTPEDIEVKRQMGFDEEEGS